MGILVPKALHLWVHAYKGHLSENRLKKTRILLSPEIRTARENLECQIEDLKNIISPPTMLFKTFFWDLLILNCRFHPVGERNPQLPYEAIPCASVRAPFTFQLHSILEIEGLVRRGVHGNGLSSFPLGFDLVQESSQEDKTPLPLFTHNILYQPRKILFSQ